MNARIGLVVIACLLAGVIVWLVFGPPLPAPGVSAKTASGGDFTLQSIDGPVALKDFRGKVVLLYFGYTYCPDICPTSLAATVAGYRQLAPAEQAKVQLLFVSVDPERDTPAHLKTYVQFFDPRLLGLTGTPVELAKIAGAYGVFYAKQPSTSGSMDYVVDHSAMTYVVDRDGRLVGQLPHAAPPDEVVSMVRQFLK